MSRRKPEPPGWCAACQRLPAMAGSILCQDCRNHARQLVAAYMSADDYVLVRSPPGSGWP